MDLLDRNALWSLMEEGAERCVSIYLPTHRAGSDIQQDPIRLKNLLRRAEESLSAGGMRGAAARELLQPARELIDDRAFWHYQGDGLALFVAPGIFHCYRLPVRFDPLVVVTDRFHIKPLISLLAGDGRFYILALSLGRVRLLHATRHSVAELKIGDLAAGLEEALGYDNAERRRQMHTGREGRRGNQAGIFHGHGDEGLDDAKDNILRHFRRVDRGLRERIPDDRAPWVLAGVDYLLSIYREASGNPYLLSQAVEGSPDRASPAELHRAAWRLVRPVFAEAQREAEARYRERVAKGGGLASSELSEVVPAAYHGRVESLFVALGVQKWGVYDSISNAVAQHGRAEPGDRDLLDLAAVRTLMNGGEVYAVEAKSIPAGDERATAAVFRY